MKSSNPGAHASRKVSLDIIRCVAIFLVILNHAVESYYNLEDHDVAVSYNSFDDSGIMFLFTLGRIGVPLFLFLTGYLMLHRDFDSPGSIKRFWIHNLLSLIITWEIWLVLYNIFLACLNGTAFDVAGWVRQMLFVEQIEITHSWYLPMIIGVYFFLPFIAKGVKNVPKQSLYIMLGVCYTLLFVVPTINLFFGTFDIDQLKLQVTPVFISTFPVTMILMGHLFYLREGKRKIPIGLKIFLDYTVFIIFLQLSVYLQLYLHQNGSDYNLWYSFFTVIPMSYCVFDVLNMISLKKELRIFRRISICSFGMYLTHRPIQMLFEKNVAYFGHTNGEILYIGTMWALLGVSFVISYALTEGLAAIPIVGELLTRIRKKKIHLF